MFGHAGRDPDRTAVALLIRAVSWALVYSPRTPALSYKTRVVVPPLITEEPIVRPNGMVDVAMAVGGALAPEALPQ